MLGRYEEAEQDTQRERERERNRQGEIEREKYRERSQYIMCVYVWWSYTLVPMHTQVLIRLLLAPAISSFLIPAAPLDRGIS